MKLLPTLCAILLSAVIVTATQAAKPVDNSVMYSETKTNVVVTPSQSEFTIKLKSNPTTGYSWFLHEYDANLIVPVKHSFVAPGKPLIGAPGYELWTFKVKPAAFIVPRQTSIRMTYARPWQGSDNATQIVFYVTSQ